MKAKLNGGPQDGAEIALPFAFVAFDLTDPARVSRQRGPDLSGGA
jgi:hypothetical protein